MLHGMNTERVFSGSSESGRRIYVGMIVIIYINATVLGMRKVLGGPRVFICSK